MDNPFGKISLPENISSRYGTVENGALGTVLNLALKTMIVVAGVYALINIMIAGYGFMSAGDDPKKVGAAWQKIWQSLLGLAFVAGAFVLAAIFGYLIFGDATVLLRPSIPTP